MTAKITRLNPPRRPSRVRPGEVPTVTIMPIVRVERHKPYVTHLEYGEDGEETIGSLLRRKLAAEGPRPRGKRRLGAHAMRRARAELEADGWRVENIIRHLMAMAKSGHDPRAIAAMIEHEQIRSFNPANSAAECDVVVALFSAVMAEYRKRFPTPKPKVVR
jgi:hypothetical protein